MPIVRGSETLDFSSLNAIYRALQVTRRPLSPPVGVRIADNQLVWEPPDDDLGITAWRIYAESDGDANLVREVLRGQLKFGQEYPASRYFVSSWSAPIGKESVRVRAVDPTGLGVVPPTGSLASIIHREFDLTAAVTLAVTDTPGTSKILIVTVKQPATGSTFTFSWPASFYVETPSNVYQRNGYWVTFMFTGTAAGKWLCIAPPVVKEPEP